MTIDMRKAIYIDSSGLGMFVKAVSDFKTEGGDLRFAEVNSGIMDILKVTSLHKVLKTYADLEKAIKSFK